MLMTVPQLSVNIIDSITILERFKTIIDWQTVDHLSIYSWPTVDKYHHYHIYLLVFPYNWLTVNWVIVVDIINQIK